MAWLKKMTRFRRGSSKSERGPEGDEPEPSCQKKERAAGRRSQPAKPGLLASSSFCCGSGQKEEADGRPSYSRPLRKNKRDKADARNRRLELDEEKPKNENLLECSKPRKVPSSVDKKTPRVNNVLSSKKPYPDAEIDAGTGRVDAEMESGSREKYTDVIRKLHKDPPHYTHNNLMPLDNDDKLCRKDENVKMLRSGNAEVASGCGEGAKDEGTAGFQSCEAEDLDCPCCHDDPDALGPDSASKSASAHGCPLEGLTDTSNGEAKEKDLEIELRVLHERLDSERLNLESQQRYILELENEVRLIQQLKEELAKEKEMREAAEEKLRKMLDAERRDTTKESAVQSGEALKENETSVIIGYESRIQNYEAYIAKLEESNAMLVSELKKLKDLSPTSQGEQAKMLLTKLNQLESDNFLQKVEYEKCLDEVANKLVHTLLVQKKTEEECKALHLRLEQLQIENAELLKFSHSKGHLQNQLAPVQQLSDEPSPELNPTPDNINSAKPINSPEIHPEKHEGSSVHYKHIRSISSPSEKPSSVSHIPAYSSQRSSANRKKIKPILPNISQEAKAHLHSNHETVASESNNNTRRKGIASPDKVPSDTKTENPSQRGLKLHTKLPAENSRFPSIKRKRLTKLEAEADKRSKDTKARSGYFQTRSNSKAKSSLCADVVNDVLSKDLSVHPESRPQVQEVWNCSVENSHCRVVPDYGKKPSSWSNNFNKDDDAYLDGKLHDDYEMAEKKVLSPLRENECSVSTDGTIRTRDEGYSTMSSDQQQDSVADTTISGSEEPSSTYVQSVSNLARDDSVTDCLDGSMTSSSDSGFGPLQQIAISSRIHMIRDNKEPNSSPSSDASMPQNIDKNICTVSTYLKDYANKSSLTMISELPSQNDSCDLGDRPASIITSIPPFEPSIQCFSTIYSSGNNAQSQVLPVTSSAQQSHNVLDFNQIYSNSNISCTVSTSGEERGAVPSICVQSCSKMSAVETAEKATLTEPEEATWREKALAHFIDESIWSLYSSESDTQFRLVSGDVVKDFSPIDPVFAFSRNLDCASVCAVASDTNKVSSVEESKCDPSHSEKEELPLPPVAAEEDLILLNNVHRCHPTVRCLERVASDSLLFQKDAVHELEDSMKPCLKASRNFATKNIPLFHHFSTSDVCSNESSFESKPNIYPEILMNLEKTMLLNNYISPSSINPSRTSSVCSLPSSNSCHIISDETEDVDMLRHSSRKGSQDPDLSSASDAEYENLEHKDFVEKWIQKEVQKRNNLKHQVESATCQQNTFPEKQKPCFPFSKRPEPFSSCHSSDFPVSVNSDQQFRKFCNQSDLNMSPESSVSVCFDDILKSTASSMVYPIIFTCENIDDDFEPSPNDIELDVLDSEVKEFNDDFYHLCDVGSSLSIDHSLPVILESLDSSLKQHSKLSPTMKYKFSQCEEHSQIESLQMPKAAADKPPSKPTVFVKPVRPVTLSFASVPNPSIMHRVKKIDLRSPSKSPLNISTPSSCRKLNQEQKLRKVSSPRKSGGRQQTRVQRNSLNSTRSTKVPNLECSYKVQPSLPVNQNLEITHAQDKRQPRGCHPELTNCNANVASRANENMSPTHATKVTGVSPKRYQARKDRLASRNSKEGCGTAWIHLQADDSLSDPKTRASLLDSMATTVSSSGSSSEDEEWDVPVQSNTHLQKICREKRKRIKASRAGDLVAVSSRPRSSVLNRHSLYYRYGEREKEAIACFDFLEDLPTSSSEQADTGSKRLTPPSELDTGSKRPTKERVNLLSPPCSSSPHLPAPSFASRLKAPILWNQPIRHNMSSSTLNSQDYEILDHVSLSDSCAESYTSTPDSFEDACA